jgi:hypothetical protein
VKYRHLQASRQAGIMSGVKELGEEIEQLLTEREVS